ncbi:sulfite exporter TauE/SafE family protein [Sphaerisporangium sp. NPDC005288]|uniref:sulfite exporter TauE/SafE family protein n=1 Tax=Sphaerisporangium sp. NPDC005288 TaxID=3155114 RepID=UPI0033B03021
MTPAALFAGGLAAGLVAGTASCTAVQGGVLIGLARGRGGRGVVPAFIGGRLLSHAAAGALLGLLGDAVRLPPPVRAALLVGAGIAVVVYAVRLALSRSPGPPCSTSPSPAGPAGSPGAHSSGPRGPHCAEGPVPRRAGSPASSFDGPEGRRPACPDGAGVPEAQAGPSGRRERAKRWGALARPASLGGATVLIPCGVTLTTETVAVSSGSWLGGAAVMAGFVAGTAPGFAVLGLLVRRVAARRLAAVAAAGALVAGAATVVAGLRLGGWPPAGGPETASGTAQNAVSAVSGAGRGGPEAARAVVRADGTQVLTIWSTDHGYRPGIAAVDAGRPTEIVFRTRGNRGCTRSVTLQGRDLTLPESGAFTVRLAPQNPGTLRYVCGMGMYVGIININKPGVADPPENPAHPGQGG